MDSRTLSKGRQTGSAITELSLVEQATRAAALNDTTILSASEFPKTYSRGMRRESAATADGKLAKCGM